MSAEATRLFEGPRAVRAFENAIKVCRRRNLLDLFALLREKSLMLLWIRGYFLRSIEQL